MNTAAIPSGPTNLTLGIFIRPAIGFVASHAALLALMIAFATR